MVCVILTCKLTSQKACLEVHTTVFKDSKAKKRFAVLRTKNTTFGVKNYWKLQKLRFFVNQSTVNRFLALEHLEMVIWVSEHAFWEVHFLWPRWDFRLKKCIKLRFAETCTTLSLSGEHVLYWQSNIFNQFCWIQKCGFTHFIVISKRLGGLNIHILFRNSYCKRAFDHIKVNITRIELVHTSTTKIKNMPNSSNAFEKGVAENVPKSLFPV